MKKHTKVGSLIAALTLTGGLLWANSAGAGKADRPPPPPRPSWVQPNGQIDATDKTRIPVVDGQWNIVMGPDGRPVTAPVVPDLPPPPPNPTAGG